MATKTTRKIKARKIVNKPATSRNKTSSTGSMEVRKRMLKDSKARAAKRKKNKR